jgi:hypothetical protein
MAAATITVNLASFIDSGLQEFNIPYQHTIFMPNSETILAAPNREHKSRIGYPKPGIVRNLEWILQKPMQAVLVCPKSALNRIEQTEE